MALSKRKFYKTTFVVEVLSEEPLADMDLDEINYFITHGHGSGEMKRKPHKILDGRQAARALIKQASDPGFFRLTEKGEDEEEDGQP